MPPPSLEVHPREAARPHGFISDWAYRATTRRDLRLDLLRGLAVSVMVVDHVGGASWLYFITGGNSFWVSAAEGFVFISGVVAGMVYGAIAARGGFRAALIRLLRRAWTLYALTVVLTLLFVPFSMYFQLPWTKGVSLSPPVLFVWNVITLRQNFAFVDIPLMWTLLLLAAPIGLALLFYVDPGWLLVASTVLWAAFQIAPTRVEIPWSIPGFLFNLAAWQLLFFVGMTIGYHREGLAQRLRRIPRWLYFLLSIGLMFWLVGAYVVSGGTFGVVNNANGNGTQLWLETIFAKPSLPFGRLAADVIVFQFAFLAVTLLWKPIQRVMGWFLLPLGQNALYSYTVHVALAGLIAGFEMRLGLRPSVDAILMPVQLMTLWTVNMIVQVMMLLVIWTMIQVRFLFRIIPR